jgi:hypothetical protein
MELYKVTIERNGFILRVLFMSRIVALELMLDYERRGIDITLVMELVN